MDMFKVLGIEPTEDKELIRQAYRDKLPLFHPEEDPGGFQRLHQAYEEALQYRHQEALELTEAGLWVKKAEEIYNDFSRRLDVQCWKEILDDDICCALDTSREASHELLSFLLSHYYIPHEVWQVLADFFGWEEQQAELIDLFPENFINYIINNAKYEDSFRYYEFGEIQADKDYEAFLRNYFHLLNTIGDESQDYKSIMEETLAMGIVHPDFSILRIRYALKDDNNELARQLNEELLKSYPDDESTLYSASQVYLSLGEYETAKSYAEQILQKTPKHIGALLAIGSCEEKQDKFEEALAVYEKITEIAPYHAFTLSLIFNINERLFNDFEELLKQGRTDEQLLMKYLKAAVASHHFKEALERCGNLNVSAEQVLEYHHLIGRAFCEEEQYDKAAVHFEQALKSADCKDKKREEVIADIGLNQLDKGVYEQALEVYEGGLEEFPGSIRLRYRKANALKKLERFNEAIALCDEVNREDFIPAAYQVKAEALFEMGDYNEAIKNCDIVIGYYPYYDIYVLKLKILEKTGALENIVELANYLYERNCRFTEIKVYHLKALGLLRKYDEAERLAAEILKEEPDNAETRYHIAVILKQKGAIKEAFEHLNKVSGEFVHETKYLWLLADLHERMKRFDEARNIYERLLKDDSVAKDEVFSYLGDLYASMKKPGEAKKYLKKALELNPDQRFANGSLADIYEEEKDFERALEYNQKQLDVHPNDFYYNKRGILFERLKKYDDAFENYQKAIDYNPGCCYPYYNIGYNKMILGDYQQAAEYYEKAIDAGYDHWIGFLDAGLCFGRMGEIKKAETYYNQGYQHYPDRKLFLERIFYLHLYAYDYDKALKAAERYMEETKEYETAYQWMAGVYKRQRKHKEAVRFYEKAYAYNKKNKSLLSSMGTYYYECKEYKKSLGWLKKAYKLDPKDADILSDLGRTYKALNKIKKAQGYFALALNQFEGFEYYSACDYYHIGIVYAELDNEEKMKKYFEKALKNSPCQKYCPFTGCADAYYEYGLFYEHKQQYDKALFYYEKAYDTAPEPETVEALKRLKDRQ